MQHKPERESAWPTPAVSRKGGDYVSVTYKLKVAERVKGKCQRHPRYNPQSDGREGIKGGCSTCYSLYNLYRAKLALDAALRDFLRRATPWAHRPKPRTTLDTESNVQ